MSDEDDTFKALLRESFEEAFKITFKYPYVQAYVEKLNSEDLLVLKQIINGTYVAVDPRHQATADETLLRFKRCHWTPEDFYSAVVKRINANH